MPEAFDQNLEVFDSYYESDPISKKEKLFQKIEELNDVIVEAENKKPMIKQLVDFVFECSAEDGLTLAKRLNFSPQDIEDATIDNFHFVMKHEKLCEKIAENLRKINIVDNGLNANFTELEFLSNSDLHTRQQHSKRIGRFVSGIDEEMPGLSEEYNKIYKETVNYYKKFLAPKEIDFDKNDKSIKFRKEKIYPKYEQFDHAEKQIENDLEIFYHISQKDFTVSKFIAFVKENYTKKEQEQYLSILDDTDVVASGYITGDLKNGLQREMNLSEKDIKILIPEKVLDLTFSAKKSLLIEKINLNLGEDSHVVMDSILNQYIISTSDEGMKNYVLIDDIQREKIFSNINNFLEDKNFEPKQDSSIYQEIKLFKSLYQKNLNDLNTQARYKSLIAKDDKKPRNIFFDFAWPFQENIKSSREFFIKNNDSKFSRIFEFNTIKKYIETSRIENISSYFVDIIENPQNTSLTQDDIAILFDQYKKSLTENIGANHIGAALKILNMSHQLDEQEIKDYFDEKNKNIGSNYLIGSLETKNLNNFLSESLRKGKDFLLKTMPAKKDMAMDKMAKDFVKAMYPQEWSEYKNGSSAGSSFGGKSGFSLSNFLDFSSTSRIDGGNFSKEGREGVDQTLFTMDKSPNKMLVTNILSIDEINGDPKNIDIKLEKPNSDNIENEKIIAIFEEEIVASKSILPAPFDAKNVLAYDQNSNEIIPQKNTKGLNEINEQAKITSFSFENPSITSFPNEINQQDYNKFINSLIEQNGVSFLQKIDALPPECLQFLTSIEKFTPIERVIKIQHFMNKHCFYDGTENEMRDDMNDSNLEDLFFLMKIRMQDIKENTKEKISNEKIFAGVCADFAKLGTCLLKQSGIPAGIVVGFNAYVKEIKSGNAHGTCGVLWPNENGKITMHVVEMTPQATTESERLAQKRLGIHPEDLEEKINIENEKIQKEAEKAFLKIDDLISKIENLVNQKSIENFRISTQDYQRLKNEIILSLKGVAKYEDFFVFKQIVDAFRFSPYHNLDLNDLRQKNDTMKFVQDIWTSNKTKINNKEIILPNLKNIGQRFIDEIEHSFNMEKGLENENNLSVFYDNLLSMIENKVNEKQHKIFEILKSFISLEKLK